jgi:hypothetical protein
MLYMPDVPIRHIVDNPRGYRSPDERKIKFDKVMHQMKTPFEDDYVEGWYMYHGDDELDPVGMTR